MKFISLALLVSSAVFADNRWIGGGSNVTIATVKAIKSRPGSSTVYFRINENPGGTGNKWILDSSTPGGKASLSTLLTAFSTGNPITFHEGACSTSYPECEVDEIILGNGIW